MAGITTSCPLHKSHAIAIDGPKDSNGFSCVPGHAQKPVHMVTAHKIRYEHKIRASRDMGRGASQEQTPRNQCTGVSWYIGGNSVR